MVLNPLVKVEVNVEIAESQLAAHHLGVALREPGVAHRDPLHRGPVEDLDKALVGAGRAHCSVAIGLAQPHVEIVLVAVVGLSPLPDTKPENIQELETKY